MFDLIIYCIGQEKCCIGGFISNIYVETEQRYCDIWKCITEQKGIWYNLLTNSEEVGGTELCEHLGFDSTMPRTDVAYDVVENLTPYKIKNEYRNSVSELMEFLINASPSKLIYVLARYQSSDKEIVQGTYTVQKFLSLMDNGNIYSNVCYIISGHPNALG